jgi:hypothetical protein
VAGSRAEDARRISGIFSCELGERGDLKGAGRDMWEFSPKGISHAALCPQKRAWEFCLYPDAVGEMPGEFFGVWG